MAKARARKRKKAKPPELGAPVRWATGAALVPLRVWAGAIFLVTAEWKLRAPGVSIGDRIRQFRLGEYVPMIERAVEHPPEVLGWRLGFYADFLDGVMLPLQHVAAPAILFFELILGLTLVLGLGTRLFASLGVLLMLGFNLAKPMPGWGDPVPGPVGIKLLTIRSSNWPLTWILLVLAVFAAGRVLGLDVWIRRRAPGWLRWIG